MHVRHYPASKRSGVYKSFAKREREKKNKTTLIQRKRSESFQWIAVVSDE